MLQKVTKVFQTVNKICRARYVLCVALVLATVAATFAFCLNMQTVTISENGTVLTQIYTGRTDPQAVLSLAGISLNEADEYDITVTAGHRDLHIYRAFPVTVNFGAQTYNVQMARGTVATALLLAGITLDDHDQVDQPLTTPLYGTATVAVTDVEYVYETKTQSVPFEVKTTYSSSLAKGEVSLSGGVEGQKEVTLCKKVVNGEVAEVTTVNETVTQESVDQIKTIGTKVVGTPASSVKAISTLAVPSDLVLDSKGKPVSYKKLITGKASAYSPADDGGTTCSTGVKCRPGYIAVNPKQIPYGTKMYIVSSDGRYVYGYAIAADTGGFVHNGSGRIVDLFFPTNAAANKFGVRNVEIYILD